MTTSFIFSLHIPDKATVMPIYLLQYKQWLIILIPAQKKSLKTILTTTLCKTNTTVIREKIGMRGS